MSRTCLFTAHTCHRVKKECVKLVHNQSSHNQNSHNQSSLSEHSHASADSSLSWSSSAPKIDHRPHSSSAYSSCNSTQSRRTRDELSAARKRELVSVTKGSFNPFTSILNRHLVMITFKFCTFLGFLHWPLFGLVVALGHSTVDSGRICGMWWRLGWDDDFQLWVWPPL